MSKSKPRKLDTAEYILFSILLFLGIFLGIIIFWAIPNAKYDARKSLTELRMELAAQNSFSLGIVVNGEDGWGRNLDISMGDDGINIKSAGPDGEFGTDDDITFFRRRR